MPEIKQLFDGGEKGRLPKIQVPRKIVGSRGKNNVHIMVTEDGAFCDNPCPGEFSEFFRKGHTFAALYDDEVFCLAVNIEGKRSTPGDTLSKKGEGSTYPKCRMNIPLVRDRK